MEMTLRGIKRSFLVIGLCFLVSVTLLAQSNYNLKYDKCGYDEQLDLQMRALLGGNWGYGYDSLLVDLNRWGQSPYVMIDSIGASVQNRALWQLTITSDNPPGSTPRKTVFIHARTHPNEVQAWWVTNEMINLLLAEDPYAQFVRENCTFYIIPMYNPDGVELGLPRQNAHGIDIESNWNTFPHEPEVAVLKSRFMEIMNSPAPIEVALNMHAAIACKRFFVYHDEVGTSNQYTLLEQDFITGIRFYYLNGIEPWDYRITWTGGTPLVYPESWFWVNHQEAVMALTYEDMNCSTAGNYDSTALAMLHGAVDFLGIISDVSDEQPAVLNNFLLYQNYPNPFNPRTTITYALPVSQYVSLKIYDLLGQEIATLVNEKQPAGVNELVWDGRSDFGGQVPSGVYIYSLQSDNYSSFKKMILIK
jgi:hypothetical protein